MLSTDKIGPWVGMSCGAKNPETGTGSSFNCKTSTLISSNFPQNVGEIREENGENMSLHLSGASPTGEDVAILDMMKELLIKD